MNSCVRDACRPAGRGPFRSVGAHGCYRSHLGVLRAALTAGHDRILVVEDDCNLADAFAELATPVLDALAARDWSHGRLGQYAVPGDGREPGVQRIEPGACPATTHLCAWRGGAIREVADFLDLLLTREPGAAGHGPQPVDGAFGAFFAGRPDLRAFYAVPTLAVQRSSRSDIAPPKWFDAVPALRGLVGVARSLRNRKQSERGYNPTPETTGWVAGAGPAIDHPG